MIILQQSKSVFFHTPRTGGNAISRELGVRQLDNKLQHWTTKEAIQWIFQETWADYWTFAFVRNPWDRYASLYEHMYRSPLGIPPKSNSRYGDAPVYSFDEWLYLSKNKFLRTATFGIPQSDWTTDVSEVFKFEERPSALPIISEKIGIQLQGLRSNASKRQFPSYTDYYKKKSTIELVREIDKVTIDRFGYKFSE